MRGKKASVFVGSGIGPALEVVAQLDRLEHHHLLLGGLDLRHLVDLAAHDDHAPAMPGATCWATPPCLCGWYQKSPPW